MDWWAAPVFYRSLNEPNVLADFLNGLLLALVEDHLIFLKQVAAFGVDGDDKRAGKFA